LEGFQLVTPGRVAVEEGAGGGVEGGGLAGFVGRGEDVEAGGEGAEAHGLAEAANVGEFEGVEDHEVTSWRV
jgi:hypothetical protein